MFEDFDFEAAARSVALLDKARKAVETRRYTDRPGDGWRLTECASLPQYTGVQNKVMISTTEDGEKYEVIAYTYAGRKVHSDTFKTLDAAFRNGVKFADTRFAEPAPKIVEPAEITEVEELAETAEVTPIVDEMHARRHIAVAPQSGDDVHAVSHLAAGSALVRSLPLSVVAEATDALVVAEERPVVVQFSRKSLPEEPAMTTFPAHVTITVTARDIRAGDVFTLHGHERTATHSTWPTALRNHVHISFVGGGDAVIPADRQFVVTRAKELGCATA